MGPELVCSLWECPFYRRIGAGTPERVPKHEWWPAVLLPSPAGTVSGHPPPCWHKWGSAHPGPEWIVPQLFGLPTPKRVTLCQHRDVNGVGDG